MILYGFLILNIIEPYKAPHTATAHNRPYLLNTTKYLGYTPHLIKYSAFLLHTTTFFTLYHTTYEHLDSCIYALTLHDHTGSLVHFRGLYVHASHSAYRAVSIPTPRLLA